MYRLPSPAERLRGFSLIEALVALSLIAVLVSLIRLDLGGALTIFSGKSIERLVESEVGLALFVSTVSSTTPVSFVEVPGCDTAITVFAGGHLEPVRLTCGTVEFSISRSGQLTSVVP